MTEREFSKQVKKFLIKNLQPRYPEIKIAERVNVLVNLTVGKVKSEWKVMLGFLEQDLVLYKDEIEISKIKAEGIFIPRATKDKKIVIPLAVIELKLGKNVNTHQFLTYSYIAKELKTTFPYCAYYFVCSEEKFRPETLLRHTKGFDRIFTNWKRDKNTLLSDLILHLNYLKRVRVL